MNPQHDARPAQGRSNDDLEGGWRGEGQSGTSPPEHAAGSANAADVPHASGHAFGGPGHVPQPPHAGDPGLQRGGASDSHGVPWGRPGGAAFQPGIGGPGHVPHAPHEELDPEYRRWREEQLRALDEDYRAWRQDRYRQFAEEFSRWRSRHAAGHGGGGTQAQDDSPVQDSRP